MRTVDARGLAPEDFEAVLEFRQRLDRERYPGLPVTPPAELRALLDYDATEFSRHDRVAVLDEDGRAVAVGHLQLASDPANAGLASVEIEPASGDAAACALAELLRRARADSRTSLIAWGDHTRQRHEFWAGLGAELRYTEQESCLDMAAVDAGLMERWASRRCTGVELVHWSRRCPEEHVDALVDTVNAMNDAPIGDLEMADVVVDAPMLRTEVEAFNALGLRYQGILAVTEHGGKAVGATEVLVNRHRPPCSWQWNTVVLPERRGRGIGRWLKAAMWRRLRSTEPEVTMLHTGNATGNAAMLAINTEMGFKPTRTAGFWQTGIHSM